MALIYRCNRCGKDSPSDDFLYVVTVALACDVKRDRDQGYAHIAVRTEICSDCRRGLKDWLGSAGVAL